MSYRQGWSARVGVLAKYGALLLASGFAFGPVYWIVNTSLKLERNNVTFPPQWWPNPVSLQQYINVLVQSTLPRNYFNAAVLAIGTSLLVLAVGIHAGYATARFQFRGKNTLLFVLLSTVMVPGIVTPIPLYLLAVRFASVLFRPPQFRTLD